MSYTYYVEIVLIRNGKYTKPNKCVRAHSFLMNILYINSKETTLLCNKLDTPPKFFYRTTEDMTKSYKTGLVNFFLKFCKMFKNSNIFIFWCSCILWTLWTKIFIRFALSLTVFTIITFGKKIDKLATFAKLWNIKKKSYFFALIHYYIIPRAKSTPKSVI